MLASFVTFFKLMNHKLIHELLEQGVLKVFNDNSFEIDEGLRFYLSLRTSCACVFIFNFVGITFL